MVKYIKNILLAVLLIVSTGLFAQKSALSKYLEQLDSTKMRTNLSLLASDSFAGRGTGEHGGILTQKYLAAYLDSCGVKPGNDDSYFQDIKSIKSFNVARRQFTVNGVNFPDDYKYENLYHQDTILRIKEIILVASGTGDNVELENIEGKTIMRLDGATSDYLDNQNPGTVINVSLAFKPASSEISERIYFTPPGSKYKYNRVSVSVNLADKLLASTGKTFKEIIDEAEKSGKPKILTVKTSAEIHGNVVYKKLEVNNVVGIIEGSDLKNEYIIVSAHHDHEGIKNGKVYNGADDNASGVTSVLEIARLMAKAVKEGKSPHRSVVFLFPAAEEKGLIGSGYYARNPLFSLTTTKACINIDMVGRIDQKYQSTKGNYIYVVNEEQTNGDLIERIKRVNTDHLLINTKDHNSLFRRSDHYNFAKKDIPSILFTSGLHNDYHTPADDTELIDFSAMWKRNRLIFSLVWDLTF
jgi:hypothetical protein